MAQLPAEYQGEFGPNVKAEILSLHFVAKSNAYLIRKDLEIQKYLAIS